LNDQGKKEKKALKIVRRENLGICKRNTPNKAFVFIVYNKNSLFVLLLQVTKTNPKTCFFFFMW